MDDLKDSVKSVTLTTDRRLPAWMELPGLLNYEVRDNHAVITRTGVTDEWIRELETQYAATADVRDLTLEDIFVEVHRD